MQCKNPRARTEGGRGAKRPVPAPTPTPVCRSAPDSFRVRITPLSGGPAAGEEVTQNGKKEHMTTRPIDDEICATCFACGRGYCKGDGRFCSTRCREAFDAGFPPAKDESNYIRAMTNVPLAAWHVVAGPPGIEIGARFYESIRGRKSDGRGVTRPAADSGRSRPRFRNDAARHSEIIPPTVPR